MFKTTRIYGLIGHPLTHSFSKKYFTDKFQQENIHHCSYELFPIENIDELPKLLFTHPNLSGLNVTIPHKQSALPYMDEMDSEATAIGAVNVIQIRNGKLKGYNSDAYGFEGSLKSVLAKRTKNPSEIQALVLGTGGASKAVSFVLDKMKIKYQYVSRSKNANRLTYGEITDDILNSHHLIINCTPLGTYPNIYSCPSLPYKHINRDHFFYDLVYNPAESLFLQKGKAQGALTMNGLPMLHLQAERSWEIWNE